MGLKNQAAYLTDKQVKNAKARMTDYRHSVRNTAILLLGTKAGLRAKEISGLKWKHVTDADGKIASQITLTDDISKGRSGGLIPMARELSDVLTKLNSGRKDRNATVILSERRTPMKTQSIINLMRTHFADCGIEGASSHSMRRTMITNAARKISSVGGSMRDVQQLARHANLQTTQRYVEANTKAQMDVIDLI
jgi:integrase